MPDSPPNLLLITTDQQRHDALGRGDSELSKAVFTPHLNWLCDQGVRFTRAYTDCPICVAARATVMTGRHGYRQGLVANASKPIPQAEHPTLPGLLTAAGYQTRAVGKMHFNPVRANYGFEHVELPYDYVREMERAAGPQPFNHSLGQNEMEPALSTVPEHQSLTHWIARRSADFLETRDPTRPFFLWTSFTKPHPPLDPDPKYWSLYDGIPMPPRVTGDWSASWDDVPGGIKGSTLSLNQVHRFTDAQLAAVRRAYLACVTQIDYNLGLLFARMRELDLLGNTWIVFTSDHGEMLGDHWLGAKSVLLEPSARVPLVVRPPAAPWTGDDRMGTTCDALACLADLLPTFLARVGVAPPDGVDGLDLLALADGTASRGRLLGACAGGYTAVIEDRYKLHRCLGDGSELLFDVLDDPQERRDLLRGGGHPEADRLRRVLDDELIPHLPSHVRGGGDPSTSHRWPGFHSRAVESDVLH